MHIYATPYETTLEQRELRALAKAAEHISAALREVMALAKAEPRYLKLLKALSAYATDMLSDLDGYAAPIEERLTQFEETR